jgi:hypothetical protein
MNMFRDLAMLFCLFVGISVMVADPLSWSIMARAPSQIPMAIEFMQKAEPFSSLVCFALALALFMTRIKY